MRINIAFLLSLTILLPIITGLIRLRRIDGVYRPFFLLLVIGLLAELISYVLIKGFHKSNAMPTNLYTLAESLLIFWQFHVWGLFRNRKRRFYGLLLIAILCWATENLLFGKIVEFSPYYRIFYYFVIVLLSVNKINYMITHDNRNLFRNPRFLICIAFIIYFIYMIVLRWAYQVGVLSQSETQITNVIIMLSGYVNALTNGIFAVAFLMIPERVKFKLG